MSKDIVKQAKDIGDQEATYRDSAIYERDIRKHDKSTKEEREVAISRLVHDCEKNPELVAERVGWLLAGHYGKGAYDAAWSTVEVSPLTCHRVLLEIIATLEWSVPRNWVSKAMTRTSLSKVYEAAKRVVETAKQEKDR